jgi:hypothetical protein
LIEVTVNPASKAAVFHSWKAEPWMGGGMAAIQSHDPADGKTAGQVRALLDKLAADPDNGIAEILDHDAMVKRGGFPDAAFVVVLKPGYYTGPAAASW